MSGWRVSEWVQLQRHSRNLGNRLEEWLGSRPGCFTRRKIPQCQLTRKLGGPQSSFWLCGKEKNLLLLLEIEPRFLERPARIFVTTPTELFPLPVQAEDETNTEIDLSQHPNLFGVSSKCIWQTEIMYLPVFSPNGWGSVWVIPMLKQRSWHSEQCLSTGGMWGE